MTEVRFTPKCFTRIACTDMQAEIDAVDRGRTLTEHELDSLIDTRRHRCHLAVNKLADLELVEKLTSESCPVESLKEWKAGTDPDHTTSVHRIQTGEHLTQSAHRDEYQGRDNNA